MSAQPVNSSLPNDLAALLRAGPCDAAMEMARKFDAVAGTAAESIVLFGCGRLGRRTAIGLRAQGIEPLAFADNNPETWNTVVDGVAVLSPQDAIAKYAGTAVFVVTVFNGSKVRRQLLEGKCPRVSSFAHLYWKYAGVFPPCGGLGNIEPIFNESPAVAEAADLWADGLSRDYYFSQLRWRLTLDSESLPKPCPARDTYFPDDLFRPLADEVFVDCGAFDGDSLRAFIARREDVFKEAVALEPDPRNFAALSRYVEGLEPGTRRRILPWQLAVASYNGRLPFDAHGDASSSATATGTLTLDCARLDDLLAGHPPTLIKMDVEGAELDALEGARNVVAAHRPVLAVCAYHEQRDLWRIPRAIKTLYGGYRLFLRVYAEDCWDVVCYAVPEERLTS
jgi:FkbM family methyltransferase